MSPMIAANFDDVPDEFKPVAPGEHELLITEPPEEALSRANKPKLIFRFRVQTEGPDNGRTIQDHISLEMLTKLKRIAMSAGVAWGPEGLNTDDLIGATVKAIVVSRIAPDRENPDDESLNRTVSQIRDYVVAKSDD